MSSLTLNSFIPWSQFFWSEHKSWSLVGFLWYLVGKAKSPSAANALFSCIFRFTKVTSRALRQQLLALKKSPTAGDPGAIEPPEPPLRHCAAFIATSHDWWSPAEGGWPWALEEELLGLLLHAQVTEHCKGDGARVSLLSDSVWLREGKVLKWWNDEAAQQQLPVDIPMPQYHHVLLSANKASIRRGMKDDSNSIPLSH